METISGFLGPYKNVIGIAASTCSILQHLAGIFVCYDVYKTKITSNVSSRIFVGNLTVAVMGLKFAALINDSTTFYLYLASILLESLYIFIHWMYSVNRQSEIYIPLVCASLICGTGYTYAALEDPAKVQFRYGLMLTILILTVLAFPFKNLVFIIQERDASSVPFAIVQMSTLVSFMWCLYSLAINNGFMLAQSGSSLLICVSELILCIKYAKPRNE